MQVQKTSKPFDIIPIYIIGVFFFCCCCILDFHQRDIRAIKEGGFSKEDLHGSGLEICSLKNEVVNDGHHQTITA